jgi:hypothetical protein
LKTTKSQKSYITEWPAKFIAAASSICAGLSEWWGNLEPIPLWHDCAGSGTPSWAAQLLQIPHHDMAASDVASGPQKWLFRNLPVTAFYNNITTRDHAAPIPPVPCHPGTPDSSACVVHPLYCSVAIVCITIFAMCMRMPLQVTVKTECRACRMISHRRGTMHHSRAVVFVACYV